MTKLIKWSIKQIPRSWFIYHAYQLSWDEFNRIHSNSEYQIQLFNLVEVDLDDPIRYIFRIRQKWSFCGTSFGEKIIRNSLPSTNIVNSNLIWTFRFVIIWKKIRELFDQIWSFFVQIRSWNYDRVWTLTFWLFWSNSELFWVKFEIRPRLIQQRLIPTQG